MEYTPDMNDGSHIFVFGSNLAGRHGKGAALEAAKHWGAVRWQGRGRYGESYAIPTKDRNLLPLSLYEIESHVARFVVYAITHPKLTFLVTPVGCGLAGYPPEQIAPFFKDAPDNCVLPDEFKSILSR